MALDLTRLQAAVTVMSQKAQARADAAADKGAKDLAASQAASAANDSGMFLNSAEQDFASAEASVVAEIEALKTQPTTP